MNYTIRKLTRAGIPIFFIENEEHICVAECSLEKNARIFTAVPDMYEALKYADELVKIARQYFPKSIKTSDKFTLENTCAAIGKALAKAEGK
jgi:hypothetical protein